MVNATIISSVRIKAEKLMATMCINSSSNRINAPYMMTPPAHTKKKNEKLLLNTRCSSSSNAYLDKC